MSLPNFGPLFLNLNTDDPNILFSSTVSDNLIIGYFESNSKVSGG